MALLILVVLFACLFVIDSKSVSSSFPFIDGELRFLQATDCGFAECQPKPDSKTTVSECKTLCNSQGDTHSAKCKKECVCHAKSNTGIICGNVCVKNCPNKANQKCEGGKLICDKPTTSTPAHTPTTKPTAKPAVTTNKPTTDKPKSTKATTERPNSTTNPASTVKPASTKESGTTEPTTNSPDATTDAKPTNKPTIPSRRSKEKFNPTLFPQVSDAQSFYSRSGIRLLINTTVFVLFIIHF